MVLGASPQPDRGRSLAQQREVVVVVDDRPAGREHRRRSLEDRLEYVALEPPVVVRAVELEDLAQRQSGGGLDPPVDLDELAAEGGGDPRADRRLARPANPEQRDRAGFDRLIGAVEQGRTVGLEGGGDLGEPQQRDVAGARPRAGPKNRSETPEVSESARRDSPRSSRRARTRPPTISRRFPIT